MRKFRAKLKYILTIPVLFLSLTSLMAKEPESESFNELVATLNEKVCSIGSLLPIDMVAEMEKLQNHDTFYDLDEDAKRRVTSLAFALRKAILDNGSCFMLTDMSVNRLLRNLSYDKSDRRRLALSMSLFWTLLASIEVIYSSIDVASMLEGEKVKLLHLASTTLLCGQAYFILYFLIAATYGLDVNPVFLNIYIGMSSLVTYPFKNVVLSTLITNEVVRWGMDSIASRETMADCIQSVGLSLVTEQDINFEHTFLSVLLFIQVAQWFL